MLQLSIHRNDKIITSVIKKHNKISGMFQQDADERRSQRNWRSSYDLGFKKNWLRFLGLKNGRSFMRYILLPSSHPSLVDYYGHQLIDPSEIV